MNPEPTTKRRIYIADNNQLYRDLLKMILEQNGYSVRLFEDGYYLLKALKVNKNAHIQLPDLIICDVAMRRMGGLALFDEIRSLTQYPEEIPFILMTECPGEEAKILSVKRTRCAVFNKSELLQPLTEAIHGVLPTSTIPQHLK